MRNILINVFQEKSSNKRSHEEDQWNDSEIFDVYVSLRLHELVEPDGNVDDANDEKQT
jgi:hypothetical protein